MWYGVMGVLTVLVLSGCGLGNRLTEKATERAIERATGPGVDVNVRDGSYTVKTDQGEVQFGINKLPDQWPQDVSAYPDGTIVYSGSNMDGSGGVAIVLNTADSVQKVMDYYAAELQKQNWKSESRATYGDTAMLQYQKDNRTVTVVISSGGDSQTSVTVSIAGE